jgi:Fe-S cluster assembly ATP-binding protein
MGLEVANVVAEVAGKRVLDGVTLTVERGSIVALMGPNGSGKTSLAYVIMGHPNYRLVRGDIRLDGESIVGLPPHERARRGILLAFQEPVEVKGVRLSSLIAAAHARLYGGDLTKPDLKVLDEARKHLELVGLRSEMLDREVNVGFSGGERKRSEILQLLVLKPRYAILDEPDSGLDVDGVKAVAKAVEALRDRGTGILLITHYARILKFIKPDQVLVMVNGRIVDRGGPELAERIERMGYAPYLGGGRG